MQFPHPPPLPPAPSTTTTPGPLFSIWMWIVKKNYLLIWHLEYWLLMRISYCLSLLQNVCFNCFIVSVIAFTICSSKNIVRHTAHVIVSWYNPKWRPLNQISNLMMIFASSFTFVGNLIFCLVFLVQISSDKYKIAVVWYAIICSGMMVPKGVTAKGILYVN